MARTQPTSATNQIIGVVLGLLMAGSSAGIVAIDSPDGEPSPTTASPTTGEEIPSPIRAQLDQLVVEPESAAPAYQRRFFRHWVDADADGCDTREEVLIAESLQETTTDPTDCSVESGEWFSLYDGLMIADAGDLDIDHVVALGEAWRSGADAWDSERRRAYANDLDESVALIAVSAATNRSKGDKDPARWRPPDVTSWCVYATAWITVKVRWKLSADANEVEALRDMLGTC
jgi:hypothetical protein